MVLSEEQEAVSVALRKQTLLPLDDCLYTLQATIPRLTRSALHRCFQRHSISRLPDIEGDNPAKKNTSDLRRFSESSDCRRSLTVHTVLTDNGTHFVDTTPEPAWVSESSEPDHPLLFRVHAFAWACEQNSIEHRRTRPKHPWTNGQVERMNRTLKDATVKLLLLDPSATQRTSPGVSHGLQLRQTPQIPAWRHTISVHLPGLAENSTPVHC